MDHDEEVELLGVAAASASQRVVVPAGHQSSERTNVAASATITDDDDDDAVSFVPSAVAEAASGALRAQRFAHQDQKGSLTQTSLIASRGALVASLVAADAATTDVLEEAERMRCDAPDDKDVVGDKAAYADWKNRNSLRCRTSQHSGQ
jgi:hypothetical protein